MIRDKRLYRDTKGKTFEDYCQERFGITRVHAHRRIAFAGILDDLLPIGNKNLPARESQARPLTALPTPELQAEAWSNAQSAAGKDQPSAKELVPRGTKPIPATERQARHADRAISFVSLIENLKPLGFKNLPATERQARHADS
ncbi:hypothetical protein CXB77_18825 [Chromatium okenii]|uniref:Uncharacterized protein n=1 Tax=Chromatium okenii TaxID=61644 RepID=A0A2S7XLU8_9GAMM|nr:hypothetical protein CXB77_18825 [Chromatium okenii]